MELNIAELDNVNTMNPYDTFDYNKFEQQNSTNYWENSVKPETKEKRKKVSFNDILSNMNLVVNKQGVLQFIVPNHEESYQQNKYDPQDNYETQNNQNYHYNPKGFSQPNQQKIPQFTPRQQNSIPKKDALDPSVKHSYIYNKYFKDYADPNIIKPSPRVPKTIEEYNQMLLEDRIKTIEQKKRIEEIKSTKLLFTSAPGTGSNPRNMVASKNNLRRMNFG
jgi:hypothetical protein